MKCMLTVTEKFGLQFVCRPWWEQANQRWVIEQPAILPPGQQKGAIWTPKCVLGRWSAEHFSALHLSGSQKDAQRTPRSPPRKQKGAIWTPKMRTRKMKCGTFLRTSSFGKPKGCPTDPSEPPGATKRPQKWQHRACYQHLVGERFFFFFVCLGWDQMMPNSLRTHRMHKVVVTERWEALTSHCRISSATPRG